MHFEFFSAVDTGRACSNNEDAVAVDDEVALAVLADGMGGYNAGEVASAMLTSYISAELGRWLREARAQASDADVRRACELCVAKANRAIFDAASSHAHLAGMGTTLVLAVFLEGRLLLGHVGDSRAYRLRHGHLTQITRDHSLLQEQLDAGLITAEEAARSLNKNLVTRAVGVEEQVEMEAHLHPTLGDDLYLLCSDGLSDMVDERRMEQLLLANDTLDGAVRALVAAANDAGGRDNIAVVLVRVLQPAPGGAAARSWWPFRR